MIVDHHVHFLATAAARLSVDVTAAPSVRDILEQLATAVGDGAGWIRAWGYDESLLAERRHPTRTDLDRLGRDRPLVLHHRTGHAAVLNSVALADIGEADHPDGVLFDRHDLLSRVPRLDPGELEASARAVSARWAEAGVAGFTDSTHTNGRQELELLAAYSRRGVIVQSVTAMIGPAAIGSVPSYGELLGPVRVGPVKLMGPPLGGPVGSAHAAGFPVAVHVVEPDVLEETLDALEASPPPAGTVDRIEHNALCLPGQLERLAARRRHLRVVVNPSFLLHRRRKYALELSAPERSWLIRMRSLVEAGVDVRAGSDSPVAPADPEEMVAAAMYHPFSPAESLGEAEARGLLRP